MTEDKRSKDEIILHILARLISNASNFSKPLYEDVKELALIVETEKETL